MSPVQKFFVKLLPEKWARSMEAESRAWLARCSCGFERSIWDLGGIRWKAAGKERRILSCPHCGNTGWHTLYKKPPVNV
jgi:Ni,Fe-hydrogenase III component G